MMALLTFLIFDGHHLLINFYASSLEYIPLGEFYPRAGVMTYALKTFANLFIFGFILCFPIIALSLLSDAIFGMLMKTMPQFNLLVVGYAVLIAILAGMMKIFSDLSLQIINDLPSLFF